MATKKVKSDIQLEGAVKLPNKTVDRVLFNNGSGELTEAAVTQVEVERLNAISSAILETSDRGAANGVASLDANSKIPSSQLPAIAITEVFEAADITARDAITIGTGDGEVQEGDVVIVTDASADAAITSGAAAYIYDGAAYKLLKAGDEVLSVNGETGVVSLDTDNISEGSTNLYYTNTRADARIAAASVTDLSDVSSVGSGAIITSGERTTIGNQSGVNTGDEVAASVTVAGISEIATSAEIDTGTDDTRTISPLGLSASQIQTDVTANNAKVSADGLVTTHSDVTDSGSGAIITGAERTKLSNIEALADVTDATNVDAAGATMNTDTDVSTNGWVIDEDDMTSDDATKVPTQQSVKAYVDTEISGLGTASAGDISETSFSGVADTATNLDVTGLVFSNGVVRSFEVHISVLVDAAVNLYETFTLQGIQKGASWDMSVEAVGDDSLVSFTIDTGGQIQYSKSTTATWVSTTIKFRAVTTSV